MGRIRNLWVLFGLVLFAVSVCDFHVSADVIPSENECRPYIEKAIHELKNVEATGSDDDKESTEANVDENASIENEPVPESGTDDDGDDSKENAEKSGEDGNNDENQSDDNEPSQENQTEENENGSVEEPAAEQETAEDLTQENDSNDNETVEENADEKSVEDGEESGEKNDETDGDSKEENAAEADGDSKEENAADADGDSKEENAADADSKEGDSEEPAAEADDDNDSKENAPEDGKDSKENDDDDSAQAEDNQDSDEPAGSEQANDEESGEKEGDENTAESVEDGENQTAEDQADSKEDDAAAADETNEEESVEEKVRSKRSIPDDAAQDNEESAQNDDNESQENANDSTPDNESQENAAEDDGKESQEGAEGAESLENDGEKESQENAEEDGNESLENPEASQENAEGSQENDEASQEGSEQESAEGEAEEEQESMPEEDLTIEFEIPKNLRPRGHVSDLLGLDAESSIKENALKRTGDVVLKELKRVFDTSIHPLESMYKYRDLSNRHFGDPEIFSKPLVLFMGPWSGGKSTILNYLTDNEYTPNSIRSGAEPSPAYFNILMHGDEPEVLDGTQLAADWTFSGLQKFGQGLMDRLRGQKLPSKLLERVNIVEIPGILEVRKQVSRYFPFNDACQWFIDRADIIFLVYDPSKLDVGPETEAILDQLKGREYQTRILLNKADQVKPEELLRVQGALIWNISPLMSSAQPPVMYTVSLWSHPFENGAPIRLLQAQERAFLTDLREAIDKRIENKIASARRFAVRIRNHAKMVDCYLTTYYNQKGLFSNKKQVSDKIIEHPQNYNIYEGLSTLTNISRYDLPDPEVYLDFFRLNPLYEFKKLSETCTYFKGCPINKLDIAIAYDLPELVGKYKKLLEQNLSQLRKEYDENCNQTEIDPPVKIINSR